MGVGAYSLHIEVVAYVMTADCDELFAKIERDVIARGVFTSVSDLRRKLMKYIRAHAERALPIRWTYTDVKKRISAKRITGTAH
jgi:hypothetical protein